MVSVGGVRRMKYHCSDCKYFSPYTERMETHAIKRGHHYRKFRVDKRLTGVTALILTLLAYIVVDLMRNV